MAKSFTERKRIRKDFGRIRAVAPMPNLIEVQKSSYDAFLQIHTQIDDRGDSGLQEVFKSVFPISDFRENSSLEFIEYSIGNWECKCGKLAGLHHLRKPCSNCGATLIADPYGDHEVLCPRCGKWHKGHCWYAPGAAKGAKGAGKGAKWEVRAIRPWKRT